MDILEKLNINEQSILFQYNLEPHDVDEDGVKCVIVDTTKKFLEIDSEKIVATYNFKFPITKVEKISVFYSYQPKYKFYVILFERFIIVLKKTNELNFVERINEVSHFYISDFYDTGRPQVVIRLLGKDQPLVTDFTPDSSMHKVTLETENRVLYGLNMTFVSQMQSLNLKTKEKEKDLEKKTAMVSKLTSGLTHNRMGNKYVPCNAHALDSPSTSKVKFEPMSIGVPWVRSYLGKWIIGFPLTNLQEKPISKINVFIFNAILYVDKTIIFVPKVKNLEGSEFIVAKMLEGHKMGILVAIIKEPLPTENVINFSFNASFYLGNEHVAHQTYLGEVSVTLEDVMSNKLNPFRTSKSFRDILAHLSVSMKTQLYLKDALKKQQFINTLKDNYGFIGVTERYIVNIMDNSVFTGVLVSVELSRSGCTVEFYTKDNRQLILLLQCLNKYQFESPTPFSRPKTDLKLLQVCLKDEIKAVQSVITGSYSKSTSPINNHHATTGNDDPLNALRYLNFYETQSFQNVGNYF